MRHKENFNIASETTISIYNSHVPVYDSRPAFLQLFCQLCLYSSTRLTLMIGLVWVRLENEMQYIRTLLKISFIRLGMVQKSFSTRQ